MRIEKQRIVLSALACGRYSYDDGEVYTIRRGKKHRLIGGLVGPGYRQIFVTNHKRGSDRSCATVYRHVFIYMLHHGMYPEGMEIDHIDRDPKNDHIENLRAVSTKENNENRNKWIGERETKQNLIRHKEIADIRRLCSEGRSQISIAKELGLNRLSTRYIIKKIESGEPLKYEKSHAERRIEAANKKKLS